MSTLPADDAARALELAAEVAKITDAADTARPLLDFNDEPARFEALLSTTATAPRRK